MNSVLYRYSFLTNACLAMGVASAFEFDRTSDVAWLTVGGCFGHRHDHHILFPTATARATF